MAISRDLYLALLSFDAYNQSVDPLDVGLRHDSHKSVPQT